MMSIKRRGIESGIGRRAKTAELQGLLLSSLGQHCPRHCPTQPGPFGGQPVASGAGSRLGPPLDIREAARLIGCSPWTIRNRLLPRGLPHFRSGASSKLIFYTDQIVRWIERQQGGQRK
jgi:hypothetical protein